MSKTTNKFALEVRQRAARRVLDRENDQPSRWAAITAIAGKIGSSGHTLLECVKKAEVNNGKRAGVPTELAPCPFDQVDRQFHAPAPNMLAPNVSPCRPRPMQSTSER